MTTCAVIGGLYNFECYMIGPETGIDGAIHLFRVLSPTVSHKGDDIEHVRSAVANEIAV